MATHGRGAPIPRPPFFYTADQVAWVLQIDIKSFMKNHGWFEGRSVGIKPDSKMLLVNFAEPDEKPDWRVEEKEFKRWMRLKKYAYYSR